MHHKINRLAQFFTYMAIFKFMLASVIFVFFIAGSTYFGLEKQIVIASVSITTGILLFAFSSVSSVLHYLAGRWLAQRRRSGRTLALVLAVLDVFTFPIGTALGFYAFTTLSDDEVKAAFQ